MPHRRTLTPALQACARSMLAALSPSMAALANNAGSVARTTPLTLSGKAHPLSLGQRRLDGRHKLRIVR